MMRVERYIQAERAIVWQIMCDLDRWAELLPTVDEVSRVGAPGPVTVGARYHVRQPGLAAAEYEVTDWRPEAGFTWEAQVKGVRTVASHTLRTAGAGTRLQLGITWTGRGAWLARTFFGRKTRTFLEREAEIFAQLAEHDGRVEEIEQ